MPDIASKDAARRTPPDIERITGPGLGAGLIISEVFRARIIITPEMKGSILEDTAGFIARFFEQRGHKVNGFNITVAADNKIKKIVRDSTGDVELNSIIVHVVQGGESVGTTYSASQYIRVDTL